LPLSSLRFLQTKRRSKLRQIHETGKSASMEDMAGLPLLSKTSDAGMGKEHMLPVSHDWGQQHRKGSNNGDGKQDFNSYKTIVLKATAGEHTS
jgi:hypothetical protein